jgi:hypothetical protein
MKSNSTPSRHVGAKIQALRQSGTLNLRAQKVQDRLFLEEDFFDPQDLRKPPVLAVWTGLILVGILPSGHSGCVHLEVRWMVRIPQ